MEFNTIMSQKSNLLLASLLLISSCTNVYLFKETQKWKTAWTNQFITTSEIEQLLKASSADPSIEGIKTLAESQFGTSSVQAVEVSDIHTYFGSDNIGLKVNNTLLLFKDGLYHGSKADLP
ncbi:hypothetical protein DWB84_07150 [Saccharophagus sp. K07]|jgi:hypothetical protein|nr:hypothetical protein [Saccharophagus sp. K07]